MRRRPAPWRQQRRRKSTERGGLPHRGRISPLSRRQLGRSFYAATAPGAYAMRRLPVVPTLILAVLAPRVFAPHPPAPPAVSGESPATPADPAPQAAPAPADQAVHAGRGQ